MRRLFAIFFFCALPTFAQLGGAAKVGGTAALGGGTGTPTSNTFTLINTTTIVTCSGSTSCSLSLTGNGFSGSTGTNHLMTVTVVNNTDSDYVTAISGAGTWTCPVGTQAHFNGSVSGCYNLSSTSGVSTLTLTLSDTSNYRVVVKEYSFTQASCSLDVVGVQAPSTGVAGAYPGVTLTLSGTSDVIEQWFNEISTNPTAVSAGWTINAQFAATMGDADKENTASGAPPTWTAGSGTDNAIGAAMAFK